LSDSFNKFSFGKVAHHFAELDSTNAEALRRLRTGPPPENGTCWRADYQSAGRGQAGNGWHASPGKNLLFSALLYPPRLAVADIFWLTQVQSLSLRQAVLDLLPPGNEPLDLRIKWPNDLYLNQQKVAGILIQNSLQGSRVQWSVIGTGLNVNQRDFPPELAQRATSLAHWLPPGTALDMEHCFRTVLAAMESTFAHYLPGGRGAELNAAYHRHLYRRDEAAAYRDTDGGLTFTATLRGIDRHGRLQLEHPNGRLELFDLKSISFL